MTNPPVESSQKLLEREQEARSSEAAVETRMSDETKRVAYSNGSLKTGESLKKDKERCHKLDETRRPGIQATGAERGLRGGGQKKWAVQGGLLYIPTLL